MLLWPTGISRKNDHYINTIWMSIKSSALLQQISVTKIEVIQVEKLKQKFAEKLGLIQQNYFSICNLDNKGKKYFRIN